MNTSQFCYYCLRENAIENGQCRYCRKKIADISTPVGLLPPGTILAGRYLLGVYIGVGGYGVTYKAYDLALQQPVAIKEYRPKLFAERAGDGRTVIPKQEDEYRYGLDHFEAEIRILDSLQSVGNVVRIYSSFMENNTEYYSMELLSGENLQEYLRRNHERVSFYDALKILLPAILALEEIHRKGTLHRDLSPDNIFICDNGSVKVIDFGASRTATTNYSNSFMPVEKEGFSPPEQHTLDRKGTNQGPWSDVYAMAGTFYRCVAGKRPPTASARIAGDLIEKPKNLTDLQFSVLEKSMSLKSADREQSMLAFAVALVDALSKKEASEFKAMYPVLNRDAQLAPPPPPTPVESSSTPAVSPKKKEGVNWNGVFSVCLDLFLFQLVPFALCMLLGGNVFLWLAGGYAVGVLLCSLMTAFLVNASPGEIAFRLSVRKIEKGTVNFGCAVVYSALRLLIPFLLAEIIYYLIFKTELITTISGCTTSAPVKCPSLAVSAGVFAGSTITLKPGKYTFGRNPDTCNMVYPMAYTSVSRTHFEIVIDDKFQAFITDMSTYGTWLNGKRLGKNVSERIQTDSTVEFANGQEKITITL